MPMEAHLTMALTATISILHMKDRGLATTALLILEHPLGINNVQAGLVDPTSEHSSLLGMHQTIISMGRIGE